MEQMGELEPEMGRDTEPGKGGLRKSILWSFFPSPSTHLPAPLQFFSRTGDFTPEASLLAIPVAHTLLWNLEGECPLGVCTVPP